MTNEMPPVTSENRNNALLIPLSIVLAGAMIAGAVYLGGNKGGALALDSIQDLKKEVKVEAVNSSDHILGSKTAEIVVIEYSDFECPFCKVFHNTMHQIVDEYDGKVAWVYRHFPIEQLHSKAKKESEASECAFDQGGNTLFWKYIDRLFATTNSNDSLDLAKLPQIASDLGLNVDLFNECLENGKYTKKIEDDIVKAMDAGASGTPYSVIINKDGKQTLIKGAEPIENVRLKIDSALK